jgi:hypothetical protein
MYVNFKTFTNHLLETPVLFRYDVMRMFVNLPALKLCNVNTYFLHLAQYWPPVQGNYCLFNFFRTEICLKYLHFLCKIYKLAQFHSQITYSPYPHSFVHPSHQIDPTISDIPIPLYTLANKSIQKYKIQSNY